LSDIVPTDDAGNILVDISDIIEFLKRQERAGNTLLEVIAKLETSEHYFRVA